MKGQLRIDTMYAFVMVDDDGTEGVPAWLGRSNIAIPLVGADEARLSDLRVLAKQLATMHGKRIELVRFRERESVEWIEP